MEPERQHLAESVRFSVPGEPFGKQRPRVVRNGQISRTYTPKETVSYENLVKVMFLDAADGKRFGDTDMLSISIDAYYSIPKSASRKRRQMMADHVIRPTKRPDMDNICKTICDALNSIAYRDDSQIVDARVSKYYSDVARVDVCIRKAERSMKGES